MAKARLLKGMVSALTVIACAVPASASAATDVWTSEGFTLGAGNITTVSFEGSLRISTPKVGTLDCPFTIKVEAEGPSKGWFESLEPTMGQCNGSDAFKGCVLKGFTSDAPWPINISTTPGTWIGGITLKYEYESESCASKLTGTHLTFNSLSITPGVVGGVLQLSFSGLATNGSTSLTGSVLQELDEMGFPLPGQPKLGIETIP